MVVGWRAKVRVHAALSSALLMAAGCAVFGGVDEDGNPQPPTEEGGTPGVDGAQGDGPVVVAEPADTQITIEALPSLTYLMAPKSEKVAVKVKRGRAVTEEIVLSVTGLRDGITASGTIPKGADEGELTFSLPAEAAQGALDVTLAADVPKSPYTPKPAAKVAAKFFVRGLPGVLDTTFGQGGFVSKVFGAGAEAWGIDVAALPDGKIVVLGEARGQGSVAMLARLDAKGVHDPAFGTAGIKTYGWSLPSSLMLQADGKLVMSGGLPVTIARANADGSEDDAFGNGGAGSGTWVGSGGETAVMHLAQNAGVISGTFDARAGIIQTVTFKLSAANGTYDGTFGTAYASFYETTHARSVGSVVRSDGRVVQIGVIENKGIAFLQRGANGTIEQSWGTSGGVVLVPASDAIRPQTISPGAALLPDGSIVVPALTGAGVGLVKINAAGQIVGTFGRTYVSVGGNAWPTSITAEPSGTFIVGLNRGVSAALRAARFDKDGKLDTTFGTNGVTTAPENGMVSARATVQADGRILVVGRKTADVDTVVARFWH